MPWLMFIGTSGYNFPSLEAISPYLEPTTSGPSTAWAIRTSQRLGCHVSVGYPEMTNGSLSARYNSVVLVGPDGKVLVNYRKHFLYYTDETWAEEGDSGFYAGDIPSIGNVSMGICKYESFEQGSKSGFAVVSINYQTNTSSALSNSQHAPS